MATKKKTTGTGIRRGKVATIKLDEATRKGVLKQLGVRADISWVPDTISITRINHTQLGIADRLVRPNAWILVMV